MNKNILKLLAVLVMCFVICGVLVACGTQGEKGDAGAKGDTGATGATGAAGADGVTPHIGTNGNWWIGETDTGVQAKGENATDCGNHQFVYETWREHKNGLEGLDLGVCSDCGDAIWKKVGHEYTSNVVAPTCTDKGYTNYTCACGHTYADNYVDKVPHTYTSVTTEATCTTAGYTTHTCACGDTYTDGNVAALGHAAAVPFNKTDVDTTVWIPDDQSNIPLKDRCETAPSYTAECVRCHQLELHEEGVVPGHKPGTAVIENNVAPDCLTGGSYDSVTYCTVCNEEQSRTNVPVEATGHKYEGANDGWHIADDSYLDLCHCEHKYVYARECVNCTFVDTKEDQPTGHKYEAWSVKTEPTTTTPGALESPCSNCTCDAHKQNEHPLPVLGDPAYTVTHDEPDCDTDGKYVYSITVDGQDFTFEVKDPAVGHTYVDNFGEISAPTETNPGSIEITCEDCDHVETITLPALNSGSYTFVQGDCYVDDKYILETTVDGDTVTVVINLDGHNPHAPQGPNDKTGELDGEYHVYYLYKCSVCGEWVVAYTVEKP